MKTVLVSAVALIDIDGRVLLAQRPEGKSMAGLWEFPGGKVEAGESVAQALARELEEEVGVRPLQARPLIQVKHRYDDRAVLLDTWWVSEFAGLPQGREGQRIRWQPIGKLQHGDFPAADRAIIDYFDI